MSFKQNTLRFGRFCLMRVVAAEKQLRDQKIILANTHDFYMADLIPTLKNENEKMRQIIVAEIAKLRG